MPRFVIVHYPTKASAAICTSDGINLQRAVTEDYGISRAGILATRVGGTLLFVKN